MVTLGRKDTHWAGRWPLLFALAACAVLITAVSLSRSEAGHFPHATRIRGPDVSVAHTAVSWHLWLQSSYATTASPATIANWYRRAGWKEANSNRAWSRSAQFTPYLIFSRQVAIVQTNTETYFVASAVVVVHTPPIFHRHP